MFLERMFLEGFLMIGVMMSPMLLLGLAIPYAVLRLRDTAAPDPQAGLKAGLQFFFSLSILLILTGTTVLVVDLIEGRAGPRFGRQEFPSDAQRAGFAIVLSGLLFCLVYFLLISILTDRPFASPARRMFLGWRFAIHGLVVMAAMTGLMIALTRRSGFDGADIRLSVSVLLVWAPSWVIHVALLRVACPKPPEREMDDQSPRKGRWSIDADEP